ncbi:MULTISPECIES: type II toxin-antitoxin system HipA family toxin [unclassified Neorhizobium]|uniref:type II toxin-antitoxin system HipA family toxin n=1 Tax=unclassified Neorhizobium TaxID=2629175 RepID=UPI001FF1AD4C|nr:MULTISPECIES: type II toxin-antitoxin system HipA family toxin [unclassified Neorhizobium]MCJ9670338.1 type II toxin-antitoxin system HipA family toxin [Neorhizobium sp. SHOUNA12B]MCJ9746593.1 type II toxin-antitoxin system HipA family toxin [Neorhizobium sp. SHOUNA12A]
MNNYLSATELKVSLDFGGEIVPVGRLATRERRVYFEYNVAFLRKDMEISPLRLPLKPGLTTFDSSLFEGLPGVFSDSLPDGWGRLLFDRFTRSQGIALETLTPLDRLAHVGRSGMGALVFEPDYSVEDAESAINLDELARQAQEVLDGASEDVLKELLLLSGSAAGARPKAMIGLDGARQHIAHGVAKLPQGHEHWLVKFANTQDGNDAGAVEYVYALMAQEAGVEMPDVHLFPAQKGAGYFATKRFDRNGEKRLHMHTACGALHSDFRVPALDYEDMIALTGFLTKDVREVEKMFRLAVFNVLAHNRDDHSKNFSFLMDETGRWALSPAYDLTFSHGPRGEQSTMVMGEGRNPATNHLQKLGEAAKLTKKTVADAIDRTREALSRWPELAGEHEVSKATIDRVRKAIA